MEKSYVFKQPGNLSTLRSAQSQSNPYSYEENMQGIPQNLLLNRDYDELNSQYQVQHGAAQTAYQAAMQTRWCNSIFGYLFNELCCSNYN